MLRGVAQPRKKTSKSVFNQFVNFRSNYTTLRVPELKAMGVYVPKEIQQQCPIEDMPLIMHMHKPIAQRRRNNPQPK